MNNTNQHFEQSSPERQDVILHPSKNPLEINFFYECTSIEHLKPLKVLNGTEMIRNKRITHSPTICNHKPGSALDLNHDSQNTDVNSKISMILCTYLSLNMTKI